MERRKVLDGLMFFPRGGSAQVVRSLARQLPAFGWDVRILSGSLPGRGDADTFFAGLDVRTVDFGPALAAADPLAHDPPFHPSFEDRPGAPDRIFASLDDAAYERQVAAWARALAAAGGGEADVLHLNHLTPINEAAARIAPDVPVVGHLHGTELLMLEEWEEARPSAWTHGEEWRERMLRWAERCERFVLLSEGQIERVEHLLGVSRERCLVLPNGFDPTMFSRDEQVDRLAHWRLHLVVAPQGWGPGEEAGSIAYREEDLAPIAASKPVFLYVGRFTAVKRLGVLIRAWALAGLDAALVLVGGHPGEWEGEHPAEVIASSGARNVFLAGWHDHAALPEFLSASDVLVLPSVREQFGQVLVEAGACEIPSIAVNAHGPAEIIKDGKTGWLVPPDDEEAMAAALVAAAANPEEVRRRGRAARERALALYAWPAIAGRLAALLDEVAGA